MIKGFNNHHFSEAIEGAVPRTQNSPQKTPFGLYAEQISGTAFTAPALSNRRTWVYRCRPSVLHLSQPTVVSRPGWVAEDLYTPIAPLRWSPLSSQATEFSESLQLLSHCGSAEQQAGCASLWFHSEGRSVVIQNHDAEFVLMPQDGELTLITELGELVLEPGFIGVVPKGMFFQVTSPGPVCGYALENYGQALTLPARGPIGANGLANERDFEYPSAKLQPEQATSVLVKSDGELRGYSLNHTPFDVAGWHGNLAPYRYDLRRFNTMGSISYDHPDPSIFTVLTSPSEIEGTANLDLVVFNERWLVADNTFRPPWYHRNVMSEFMGLVLGQYDAKPEGFVPGGFSLHNAGAPHGPDEQAYTGAINAELKPTRLGNTLAFMFETRLKQKVPKSLMARSEHQNTYADCWSSLTPVSRDQLTGDEK